MLVYDHVRGASMEEKAISGAALGMDMAAAFTPFIPAGGGRAMAVAGGVGRVTSGAVKAGRVAKSTPAGVGAVTNLVKMAATGSDSNPPTGGTYILRDPNTQQIMRTGRAKTLSKRKSDHKRDQNLKDFIFEVDKRTNDYASQRGREQIIHDLHKPPLNKIEPISPRNKNRQKYLDAGRKL
jgi:hypothetical protein